MSWYARSLIFVFRVRRENKSVSLFGERITARVPSAEIAAKAEELGPAEQVDDEFLTLRRRPAFLPQGVRKVVAIQNPFPAAPNARSAVDKAEYYSEFA